MGGELLGIFSLIKIKTSISFTGSNDLYNFSEKINYSPSKLINEDFDSNYIFNLSDFNKVKNISLGITSKLFLKALEGRNSLLNFLKRKNNNINNLSIYSNELKNTYKSSNFRSFFNLL